ncbi:SpoIIE family protein phosphatase [Streptomyces formicae]|uniref:SpoIIE family protein phosphatase n=1 Tax=Streptomyces formicae TaxID=1616117 RepID=A0ABY3WNE3_9ACTN|nr:SpoIIE family protein phosphatase [Streptomyces formicae]UNM12832.1 SpoIIE family protein phosphatase [Streptomyces formicae]
MGASDVTHSSAGHGGPTARDRARVVVDAHGVVTGWSAAAERLFGHTADRVVGRPAAGLLAAAGEPGAGAEGVVHVRHSDGRAVACRLGIRLAPGPGSEPQWEVTLVPAALPDLPDLEDLPDRSEVPELPDRSDVPAPGARPASEPASDEEVDRALLEALFTQSPIGLFVLDPELRLIRFNSAAQGMRGTPAAEALGKRPSEVWPDFSSELTERVMGRVLDTGESAIGFEKRGRPPADPGREHVYAASAFRLQDRDGRVLGAADAVVDVTDRHLAQQRLALLAEGGARIGSTLDVLRTAQELVDVAVPRLADTAAIEVLEPVLAGEELAPGPVPPGAVLRRAASRSIRSDAPPGVYEVGEVSTLPVAAPSNQALADLQPRLVSPVRSDSEWVLRDPVRGRRMLEEQVHSLMLVPLVTQNQVLGLAAFYRWGEQGPFDENDLTLATELGRRTAVCMDNARRYLRERNSLVALQRSLLPGELPHHHGVEVAHDYVHAGAGGDWVDVVPLSGARVALVAGSVPGRGVPTAAAMGRLRAAVHTLSDLDLEPDELLARLDDLVRRLARDEGSVHDGHQGVLGGAAWERASGTRTPPVGEGAGCSCLYVVYDPITQSACMAAAGHPGPVVAFPDGTVKSVDLPVAAPLGRPGPLFEKSEIELPEGSTLALYTPGLLQAQQGEAGEARLAELLARAPGSVHEISRMLTEALVPDTAEGDAAVLVARTHALGPGRVASWDLPSDPAVVSTARSLVTHQLESWALDEAVFTTELIASELVTNAIRYAKAPVRLRLIRDQVLTCEVSDGSSTAPRLRHARTTDEGGRGLLLVAQCSERWGTRYTGSGKTIWAEQSVEDTV